MKKILAKIKQLRLRDLSKRKNDNCQAGTPRLILHVGLPKTGTTAIQRFLFNNRKLLKDQFGVFYPENALHWHQHVPLAKALISSQFKEAHFNNLIPVIDSKKWLEETISTCQRESYGTVVLSSEFFWAAPAMQLGLEYHEDTDENLFFLEQAVCRYKDFFSVFKDVRVIIYLRRQDLWLESFFNQQLKNGFGIPTDEELMPARIYLLYSKNIALWEKYFGKKNLLVQSFERVSSDILADFCGKIGVGNNYKALNEDVPEVVVNSRLSPRALRVMRCAVECKVGKEQLELLREVLTETSARIPQERWVGEQGVFSIETQRKLLSAYHADNIKLAQSYPVTDSYLTVDQHSAFEKKNSDDNCSQVWEEKTERLIEMLISRASKI